MNVLETTLFKTHDLYDLVGEYQNLHTLISHCKLYDSPMSSELLGQLTSYAWDLKNLIECKIHEVNARLASDEHQLVHRVEDDLMSETIFESIDLCIKEIQSHRPIGE